VVINAFCGNFCLFLLVAYCFNSQYVVDLRRMSLNSERLLKQDEHFNLSDDDYFKIIALVVFLEILIVTVLSFYYQQIDLVLAYLLVILGNSVPIVTSILLRNWIGTINNEKNPVVHFILSGSFGLMLAFGMFRPTLAKAYFLCGFYFIGGIVFVLYLFQKERRAVKINT